MVKLDLKKGGVNRKKKKREWLAIEALKTRVILDGSIYICHNYVIYAVKFSQVELFFLSYIPP